MACPERACFLKILLQVGVSAGQECKAALQEVTQLVEDRLTSNKKELKLAFGAAKVSSDILTADFQQVYPHFRAKS